MRKPRNRDLTACPEACPELALSLPKGLPKGLPKEFLENSKLDAIAVTTQPLARSVETHR